MKFKDLFHFFHLSNPSSKYVPLIDNSTVVPATKINNFFTEPENNYYVALSGNLDAFTNLHRMNQPLTNIPTSHFFKSEEAAFAAAKQSFSNIAFTIFKIEIPPKQLADKTNGKGFVQINLFAVMKTMKGFNSRDNSVKDGKSTSLEEIQLMELVEPRSPTPPSKKR